jgi:hypothetical protein
MLMKNFGARALPVALYETEAAINTAVLNMLVMNQNEILQRLDRLEECSLLLNQGLEMLAKHLPKED